MCLRVAQLLESIVFEENGKPDTMVGLNAGVWLELDAKEDRTPLVATAG